MTSVLVVESEPSVRKRLRPLLRGLHVEFIDDTDPLKRVRQLRPSLILLDTRLRKVNGFELSGRLLADSATREIPVLFLTASPSEARQSDFIVDSADAEALLERIHALLESGEREKVVREALSMVMPRGPEMAANEFTASETRLLESGGLDAEARLRVEPIARRAVAYADLIRTGLSTMQAAERLGVNASRIRQRLTERQPTLYGIRRNREWILPAFQFGEEGLVPNIDRVIARLDRELDPVAAHRWFTSSNIDLEVDDDNVSPLEWLRAGLDWMVVATLAADL